MKNKYETPDYIKQELAHLLRWYKLKSDWDEKYQKMLSEDLVDAYFVEKDIALYGELRRIHGANTRNAKKELIFIACASLAGIVVISLSYSYFDWFSKINTFVDFISNYLK